MKADAVYILDYTALEALWGLRVGQKTVEHIFQQAQKQHLEIYLTVIDLGKAYRRMVREKTKQATHEALEKLEESPVNTVVINKKIALEAMDAVMDYGLDESEGFACAMAVITEGTLVTSNPAMDSLKDDLEVLWLTE